MSRGTSLKPEEEKYIQENCLTKTDVELAKHLNRDIRTIKTWRKKLGIHKGGNGKLEKINVVGKNDPIIATRKLSEDQRKKFFQTQLINSLFYDNLKEQFTPDEIEFYLEEWGSLCIQFEDIVQTEKRQIDEYIKAELMGNRILRNVKVAEDEIKKIIDEVTNLYATTDIKNDEEAQERDYMLQTLIRTMHGQTQVMANDYQKNVELRNKLLNELNARRRDRIDQFKKSKTTFIGLVEALREKDIRESQGRHIELVRLSREKKKSEWRKPVRFPENILDCVLMDEDSELPEKDIVLMEDIRCRFIDKYSKETGKNILIIDDETYRHNFFYQVLKGNELYVAKNTTNAKELLKERDYDLVCLDYDLGLKTKGSEAAEFILQEGLCQKTDILIHSMNKKGFSLLRRMLEGKRNIEAMYFEDIIKIFGDNHA
jgi:CheY-like chemotaxis protein